jgi:hypothetical protein
MQDSLSSSYRKIAYELNAQLCEAGNVWRQSVNTDSTVILWDSDFSHPSLAGSYLTACAFYSKIFNSPCTGSNYYAGLPAATAQYLQSIATNYVLKIADDEKFNSPDFILHENYPNPFNSSTVINYEINRRIRIDISIYNTEGRLIEILFSGIAEQGRHKINWKAKSSLASGIYFITLNNDVQIKTGKLIYIK